MANYEHRSRNNRTESPLPVHINKSVLCRLYRIILDYIYILYYIDEYYENILHRAFPTNKLLRYLQLIIEI